MHTHKINFRAIHLAFFFINSRNSGIFMLEIYFKEKCKQYKIKSRWLGRFSMQEENNIKMCTRTPISVYSHYNDTYYIDTALQ